MWDPQCLRALWAFTAWYRDTFTFYFAGSLLRVLKVDNVKNCFSFLDAVHDTRNQHVTRTLLRDLNIPDFDRNSGFPFTNSRRYSKLKKKMLFISPFDFFG
jgi:hypothetical protein